MIQGTVQTLEPIESRKFKKWVGVCPVQVVAVNPNATRMKEIFPQRKDWGEPQYLQNKEYKGAMHKWATIDLYLQGLVPDKDSKPIFELRINLIDCYNYNKDKTKVQVIDRYAQTTWLPTEDVKAKVWKEEWSNRIDKEYRPCIVGEATLLMFLQKYVGIPNVRYYDPDSKTWKYREGENKRHCECMLDHLKDVFKGDFKEILDLFNGFKESWIRVMIGIRHTDTGKIIHIVNDKIFANAHNFTNTVFEREIKNEQKFYETSGTTPYVTYSADPIHEYIPGQVASNNSEPQYATNVEETGQTVNPAPAQTREKPKKDLFEQNINDDDDDLPF